MFAGTGSLGIEALSRGAAGAVFVDKCRECSVIIRENLAHTKFMESSTVIVNDVGAAIGKMGSEGRKFDIIFLDPPYSKNFVEKTLNYIVKSDIITGEGIIVAEHDVDDVVPEEIEFIKRIRSERYGDTVLSFYRKS